MYDVHLICICIVFFLPNRAQAAENDALELNAESAILVDAETGKILYSKNADDVLGIAQYDKNDDRVSCIRSN